MIPIALLLAMLAAFALAAGGLWLFHLIAGMRETMAKFEALEKKVDGMRDILEDWMLGNVNQADVKALFRRTFDDARERTARR